MDLLNNAELYHARNYGTILPSTRWQYHFAFSQAWNDSNGTKFVLFRITPTHVISPALFVVVFNGNGSLIPTLEALRA